MKNMDASTREALVNMILNVILITIIFSIATQLPGFINFSSAVFTASILSPSLAPFPLSKVYFRPLPQIIYSLVFLGILCPLLPC